MHTQLVDSTMNFPFSVYTVIKQHLKSPLWILPLLVSTVNLLVCGFKTTLFDQVSLMSLTMTCYWLLCYLSNLAGLTLE